MKEKLRKYIAEQPHIPTGFRYKTPILVSDSKGYTLRNAGRQNEFPTELWCITGAKTHKLVDLIEERIDKAINRYCNIIIYLWSGTCDITTKSGRYIKLSHISDKTVKEIVEQFERAITIIQKYPGAEIKFIDCPLLSIVKYNKHKGHKHSEHFKADDFKATEQIKQLNSKILALNSRLSKTTIRVSKYYFRARKLKPGKYRKSINISINQRDGVHPDQLLSLAITKHILLDTYSECYNIIDESDKVQLRVEEEELQKLF